MGIIGTPAFARAMAWQIAVIKGEPNIFDPTQKIEWKILLASILTILAIEIPIGLAVAKRWFPPLPTVGLVRLVEIILLVIIVIKYGKGLSSIGFAREQWLKGLKRGLIWSVAFGIFAGILFIILYMLHINPLVILGRGLPFKGYGLIIFFLVGGLISPIAEEIFFRGILYGFLRRWGVVLAIICSTAIFALIHSRGMSFPLTQIVGGIVFAIAYEVEGNLVPPITIHVLGNMAIFTIPLMA
jgi:membrane protease YdiL (CAAX protease family)